MTKAKKFIAAILLCLMLFPITVSATETADIYPFEYAWEEYWYEEAAQTATLTGDFKVKSAILMEAATGNVLFSMNENEGLPIASVTKIMSTLLIMEALDSGRISLSDVVTVSEYAASMGGSQVYLEQNEQINVDELLKALVVVSANDATLALAEFVYGNEETFIAEMNKKAEQLGMTNTHFVNTNGLPAEGHFSSAKDVALMTQELLKHELIFNYTTIWMDTIRNGQFGLANTNKLVRFYDGANGMKTGFTAEAGHCLSGTALRDGMQLIAVVLGGETSDERFSVTKKLLDFGFANYAVITPESIELEPVKVLKGTSGYVGVTYEPQTVLVEKAGGAAIEQVKMIDETVEAPILKGDKLGCISYRMNGEEIAQVPVYAVEDIAQIGFISMFGKILKSMFSIF